jgi:hypothetical protein
MLFSSSRSSSSSSSSSSFARPEVPPLRQRRERNLDERRRRRSVTRGESSTASCSSSCSSPSSSMTTMTMTMTAISKRGKGERHQRETHFSSRGLKVRANGFFGGGNVENNRSSGSSGSSSSGKKTTTTKKSSRQYSFPADYDVMVQQARQALQKAIEDGVDLGEIQFPPGGLDLAPGDLEGNVECTLTATVLRKILRGMKEEEKITVLFPDPTELKLAKRGQTGMCAPDGVAPPEVYQTDPLFEDWRGMMNYLDDPNALSVSGLDKIFGKSATVNDRVDINGSNLFVCAYPSGNIAELTQTRLLYENVREENESTKKKKSLVVVNGELDRTRSNYYPWFWNKNEMEPLREFAQSFEGIYFIHNFKGTTPAVLFRCYPDDWRVFRRRPNDVVECVWSSSTRPKSLKEVALEILPKCP